MYKTVFSTFDINEINAKIKKTNARAFTCAKKSGFIIKNNDFTDYQVVSLINRVKK